MTTGCMFLPPESRASVALQQRPRWKTDAPHRYQCHHSAAVGGGGEGVVRLYEGWTFIPECSKTGTQGDRQGIIYAWLVVRRGLEGATRPSRLSSRKRDARTRLWRGESTNWVPCRARSRATTRHRSR